MQGYIPIMTGHAGGKDPEGGEDAVEKQLPPFIPVVDESDRLTDLMEYWDVTQQQRQEEAAGGSVRPGGGASELPEQEVETEVEGDGQQR